MKVALLLGGTSPEREVSLRSGGAIKQALTATGHDVLEVDPKNGFDLLLSHRPDACFIALHGKDGEDGTVQGLLECLKIPYTGSGVMSSALCYDKILTKAYLRQFGIVAPQDYVLTKNTSLDEFLAKNQFQFPVVAKPSREGSTFGITIAKDLNELRTAVVEAKKYCSDILVEQFIQGKEVTVGILNGKALPVVEIAPKKGFFDFESKYTAGQTEYFVPARIDENLTKTLQRISENICEKLNCEGAPRLDFMIGENNIPYFLEINTIPGMTETSLLPKAAKSAGMDFQSLCAEILKSARLKS